MLTRLNRFLEKMMPIIIPVSVLIGVMLAHPFKSITYVVPWVFAFMTFSGSLSANFHDLKRILSRPLPILYVLLILHVIMPLLAWGVGHLLFAQDVYTITGMILLFVIPTGIISFMWVSIFRGSVALTLTIILADTLLAPFLVPSILSILIGAKIHIDIWPMMRGLLWMIVLPSLLGMLTNQMSRGKVTAALSPRLAPFTKFGLISVVAINSSVIAPYLTHFHMKLLEMVGAVLLLAAVGYLLGLVGGKLLRQETAVLISLTFNCGMRNISAGAVIAIAYFPAPVALPVIMGTLFQQTLSVIYGKMLQKFTSRLEN